MSLEVTLEKFQGPLDLLLHLIEKNKVDIYDIPIVLITEQYLDYVSRMDREDLDLVSEFLLMAATLLDIKAKMLLPKQEEDEEEEDPRQELAERLAEYRMFKYMSEELKEMHAEAELACYHEADLPQEVEKYVPPADLDQIFQNVTMAKMNAIFRDVLKRQEDRKDPIRSRFGTIEMEEISLNDTISHVEEVTKKRKKIGFRSLLKRSHSRMEVIVTFLAVLELMKNGSVHVEQDHIFDEIVITTAEEEEAKA
ncbi:MAG: segregation/condensation protein A [Lachnospiraceae bacterium]|nr:segregation/condensation protein A [Lachnospiraceae bacterium]